MLLFSGSSLQSFPPSSSRNSPRLNAYRAEELSDLTKDLTKVILWHMALIFTLQNNIFFLGVQTQSSKENLGINNIFHLVLKPHENFSITWFHLETINLPWFAPSFGTLLGQTETFDGFFTPASHDPHQQHWWVFQKEQTDLKILLLRRHTV